MKVLVILSALLSLFSVPAFGMGKKPVVASPPVTSLPAPTALSMFTSCLNAISGSWTYGNAPTACNVSPAQSTSYALVQYAPEIHHDGVAHTASMTALYATARDVGTYYLKRRNPSVSAAELAGFLQGLYTLLNQESFWTHYRLGTDVKLRYMRGDALHGYGMMQIDDRSHAAALNEGKGVDLIENMLYGLDIYYAAWVRSASAVCVSSATDYASRARSAWSAYNGGPGRLCRWADTSSADAPKDAAYLAKFHARGWLSLVTNVNQPVQLDVVCMAEGVRPCVNP
jgi:hypothetical protein